MEVKNKTDISLTIPVQKVRRGKQKTKRLLSTPKTHVFIALGGGGLQSGAEDVVQEIRSNAA